METAAAISSRLSTFSTPKNTRRVKDSPLGQAIKKARAPRLARNRLETICKVAADGGNVTQAYDTICLALDGVHREEVRKLAETIRRDPSMASEVALRLA